jgi:glycosyltransferase involved in cell wall biosynthesis
MLKIAYIGQKGILNSRGGGVETHVEELSARMCKKGYEIFLYTRPYYTPKEYKKFEEVVLVSIPSIHTKHLDAISHTFFSIIDALKRKVDIIHIHGVGPALLSFLPRIISPRTKVIVTAHSEDWEHKKWNWFARLMLKFGAFMSAKFAHEVFTVSQELQKYYLNNFNRSIKVIPNGVNCHITKETESNILAQFGLQKNKYILSVSRLIRHKGIHYLIEAFKRVKENPNFSDFKLVIVGQTFFTDDYFEFLKKLVDGRGDIVFAGSKRGQELEELHLNSYMYASASQSEGLSIATLEAMSYGKTVLVSDISSNNSLISGDSKSGNVGFAFENKNIADLAEKLEILMSDNDVVRKVGAKARGFVKAYYNWDDISDRISRVYKNIVFVGDKAKDFRIVWKRAIG